MQLDGYEVRSDLRYAVQPRPPAEVKRFQPRTESAAPSDFSSAFGSHSHLHTVQLAVAIEDPRETAGPA
jgi:hypothetical protein